MRRVVVTGLGAVTPLGVGVQRTWTRLLAGESGVVSTRPLGEEFRRLPSQVAGLVPLGKLKDGCWDASEHVSKDEVHKTAKFTQYALAATEEALTSANWKPTSTSLLERTGVCLGSGIGNLSDLYDTSLAYAAGSYRKIHPLFVPRLLLNLGAGMISMRYGFQGPNHCASTACTTGAHSLGDAMRFIQHGAADVMVAGSAESCIHPLAIGGFARSRSLSTGFNDTPEKASRPFDRRRDGFVIGEGAGVLVLEELSHALSRNAPIHAELIGYGATSDAHHLTAPPSSGSGALRAMKMALSEPNLPTGDVSYINAHATSTPLGDAAEMRAIKTLFSGSESDPDGLTRKQPKVSSSKGAIGHLLGGAGSVEAIFAVLTAKTGRVPPTLNLHDLRGGDEGEEEVGMDYVSFNSEGWDDSGDENDGGVEVALSNSFGFGGTNASLCFRRFEG